MQLHFLGTTGYHPNNDRQTACLMLPEIGVVLDAGTGMFRVRDRIATSHLDIFLSHVHLDHCIGLTFLFDILFERPLKRVTVHCEADKLDAINHHLFQPQLFPARPDFELVPLADGPMELVDGSRLSHFPLRHPGGVRGFRIDWPDRSLAYVTDTTAAPDADYLEQVRGVDTLIHECYFPDGWEAKAELTGHSCLTPVAEAARAAGVGRLFLVHVSPLETQRPPLDLAQVSQIYSPIEIAYDQQVIEV